MSVTTPPEIPEAIVEKAARAHREATGWSDSRGIKAIIEAIALRLRAEGMREAVEFIAEKLFVEDYYLIKELILARAADIEGGKG